MRGYQALAQQTAISPIVGQSPHGGWPLATRLVIKVAVILVAGTRVVQNGLGETIVIGEQKGQGDLQPVGQPLRSIDVW